MSRAGKGNALGADVIVNNCRKDSYGELLIDDWNEEGGFSQLQRCVKTAKSVTCQKR